MGTQLRTWPNADNSLFLVLKPSAEMTWNVLGTLLFAIRLFVRDNPRECRFLVYNGESQEQAGFGAVGGWG